LSFCKKIGVGVRVGLDVRVGDGVLVGVNVGVGDGALVAVPVEVAVAVKEGGVEVNVGDDGESGEAKAFMTKGR